VTQPTLLFSGLFACASAGIYGYVGWRLQRRILSSAEARRAWQLFIIWWYGLAVTSLSGGLMSLGGALGLTSLLIFMALSQLGILFICVALWGLLYYLIYLFTGNRRVLVPLSIAYIACYCVIVYYIIISDPYQVELGRWNVNLVYNNPPTGPLIILTAIMLIFPPIIGSVAYFLLFFKIEDSTQKYRILLVSGSIFFWFGSILAAAVAGVGKEDWWQIVSRLIGLIPAFGVLLAYLPPRKLKRRYSLISVDDEPGLRVPS